MFPSWKEAREAAKEIMQGEFGYPSVFRLSDPEETDVMLKLYGVEDTILKNILDLRGYKPFERCFIFRFYGWRKTFL